MSEAARGRVNEGAARLGYRPNTRARRMIAGPARTIGVVVPDIQLAFFGLAVRGIGDAAHAEGFEVILVNTDEDLAEERAAVHGLVARRVDGLIVAPADPTETAHLQEVVDRGIPILLLDRGAASLRCDVVLVDNPRAARNAVDYLIRLGHRRIAIVMDDWSALPADQILTAHLETAGTTTCVLREAGWAAALHGAGLPVTDDLIRSTRYDRAYACAAVAAAIDDLDRPTALLTTDELMTMGAIDAILEAGLHVPGDISIIAFDDSPWATIVQPPLTVIAQPVYELGTTAARQLLARLAGHDGPPRTIFLETRLIVRGSTGPPPGPPGGGQLRA